MKKRNYDKPIAFLLLAFAIPLANTGCYTHSEARELLAKDIRSRYGAVMPGGLEVLESIDRDTEKLVASRRAKFDLLKETNTMAMVDKTWSTLVVEANELYGHLISKSMTVTNQIAKEEADSAALAKRITDLDKALEQMDKAIAKIQNDPTLKDRLDRAEAIIKQTTQTFTTLVPPPGDVGASPVDARLSQALGDINSFLGSLKSREKTEQTYSLFLEALRMGRDITALEQESLQQEFNFHERSLAFYRAQEQLLTQRTSLDKVIFVFGKYPDNVTVRTTVATLAEDSDSGRSPSITTVRKGVFLSGVSDREMRKSLANDDLRNLLEQLAQLQTLQITNDGRLNELDLRLSVEKYRNARLLDAIYERQRMSLISFGLDGVVRYSEGGFRPEDIGRMIGIAQTIAQIVIGIRVGR